jgi:hypothetical protein
MAASLWLPRLATLLGVGIFVLAIAAANTAALLGAELGGLPAALDRFGPPLVSSVVYALRDWIAPAPPPGDALALGLRLLVWLLASVALLLHAFRRAELR